MQGFKWSDGTRQLLVQVGTAAESAGPFWAPRKPAAGGQRLHWAHLPMAGRRCEVVLTLREGQPLPDAPWAGEQELPFSNALSRLVLDPMLEGATMSQLCRMLDLPLSDLWKYKFRLDHGSARPPQAREAREAREAARPVAPVVQPAAQRPPLPVPVPPPVAARPIELTLAAPRAAGDETIPPEDAPVWLALLTGRQTIAVRALGLKLLLAKLTREAATHRDADLHRQAAAQRRLRHRGAHAEPAPLADQAAPAGPWPAGRRAAHAQAGRVAPLLRPSPCGAAPRAGATAPLDPELKPVPMNALTHRLVSLDEAARLIQARKPCCIAGNEALLRQLPRGDWIGGTIPYFMADSGGTCSRQQVFVTERPAGPLPPSVRLYPRTQLSRVCIDGPSTASR